MRKVSVVIPVYKVENYIKKCVDSIINQTYENIEIILVDDGGNDNCPKICDEYAKKDQRIKVIHKENGGLSDARNEGIKNSTGDYIMFVDSDDWVDTKIIEHLVKIKEKYNADIAICNRFYAYEDGSNKLKYDDTNKILKMNSDEALIELCSFNNFDMSAWAKLYNNNLFDNIKFPVGKLCEDYYIMYQLFDLCQGVVYSSKPLYYYLQRKGSITKNNKKILMDYIYASNLQTEFICKNKKSLIKYVKTSNMLSYMTVYNQCLDNGNKISGNQLKEFRKNVKSNLKYLKSNDKISNARKIQIYLFCYNILFYDLAIKIYKKIF